MMEWIVYYQKNDKDIIVTDQKVVHRGWIFMRKYTIRWQLCVQWRDVSTSWQAIKDLNESHPVAIANYAVAQ